MPPARAVTHNETFKHLNANHSPESAQEDLDVMRFSYYISRESRPCSSRADPGLKVAFKCLNI